MFDTPDLQYVIQAKNGFASFLNMNVDNNTSAWGLFFIYLKWISTVSFRRQQIKSIVFSRLWLFSAFLAPFYLLLSVCTARRGFVSELEKLQGFCCWWAETSRKQVEEWFPIEIRTADTLQWGLEAICPCRWGRKTGSAVSQALLCSYPRLSPAPNAHNFHAIFRSRV